MIYYGHFRTHYGCILLHRGDIIAILGTMGAICGRYAGYAVYGVYGDGPPGAQTPVRIEVFWALQPYGQSGLKLSDLRLTAYQD